MRGTMQITWYGTASLLIDSGSEQLLVDPFITYKGATNRTSILDFIKTENILITHGHLDHLSSIPKILDISDATVYCGEISANTLEMRGVDANQIVQVTPGNKLTFGDIKVTVLLGKHVAFDKPLVRNTLLSKDMLHYFPNLVSIGIKNHQYPEAGETLCYFIEACNKKILLLGSMALAEDIEYPEYVDLLILPYQGCSDLEYQAINIIDQIKPRTLIIDHFDNAYPPISKTISTISLKKILDERYPDLPVVKPTAGKCITLL